MNDLERQHAVQARPPAVITTSNSPILGIDEKTICQRVHTSLHSTAIIYKRLGKINLRAGCVLINCPSSPDPNILP